MCRNQSRSACWLWHLLALLIAGMVASTAFAQTATDETTEVAEEETEVIELKVGELAPLFELNGLEDRTVKLKDFRTSTTSKGKNVVVVFVRAYW